MKKNLISRCSLDFVEFTLDTEVGDREENRDGSKRLGNRKFGYLR
jgi:hypothetical protein